MSRGPGRIERAIEAVFAAEPDNAFTTEDLCDRVYNGANGVEKKHRVAVLRAVKNIITRRDVLGCYPSGRMGGTLVFCDRTNVMSYAMARLKSDCAFYQDHDPRRYARSCLKDSSTEAELHASLAEGGRHHERVIEGGVWWRHTQSAIGEIEARRAGDDARLQKVLAERKERANAAFRTLIMSSI
jgi:hypothetical protein